MFRIEYHHGVVHAYKWSGPITADVQDLLPTRGRVDLFWHFKSMPSWTEPYDREVAPAAGHADLGYALQKGHAAISVAVRSVAISRS